MSLDPKGDLLALLANTIDGRPKCGLQFQSEVIGADTKKGTSTFINNGTGETTLEGYDLIAFADGVHGIGQTVARKHVHDMHIETHSSPYLTATITKNAATKEGLDLTKIHFFPCEDSLGIGLPNHDGTISLLIEGRVKKNHKNQPVCPFTQRVFDFEQEVFTTPDAAQDYLKRENPKLVIVMGESVNQLTNKQPQRFIQSSVSDWCIPKVGVLVGDAGSCAPPWAEFGMNLACSHADDLARLVAHQPNDLKAALMHDTNADPLFVLFCSGDLRCGQKLQTYER